MEVKFPLSAGGGGAVKFSGTRRTGVEVSLVGVFEVGRGGVGVA